MKDFITYRAIYPKRKCYYIGFSSRGLKIRKGEHFYNSFQRKQTYNTKFYNFLRKHKQSFRWKTIGYYNTEEQMIQGEIDQIKIYKEKYPGWICLNSTDGGEGLLNPSKKTRKKMGEKKKGKPRPKKVREKIKKSKKDFFQTTEGKKCRKRMSEARIKRGLSRGKNNPMFNKHHTEEAKSKMREKKLGKYIGPNNPRAREVVLISPEGEEFQIKCYKKFCENNTQYNLSYQGICRVLNNRQKQHKGWKASYL